MDAGVDLISDALPFGRLWVHQAGRYGLRQEGDHSHAMWGKFQMLGRLGRNYSSDPGQLCCWVGGEIARYFSLGRSHAISETWSTK
jgi:hypothetical protein